jgi:catechol 2,3-dioxygenase-like lactoylglutathione lyase family enzyme
VSSKWEILELNSTFISPICGMRKRRIFLSEPQQEEGAAAPRNVTLRVYNLKPMKRFYRDLLGFKLLGEFPSAALLSADAGVGGQFQMLGLLQRSLGMETSPATRIAFNVSVPDHESERKRLEGLGLRVNTCDNRRTGRRALCFRDPEGNEVELLCRRRHE